MLDTAVLRGTRGDSRGFVPLGYVARPLGDLSLHVPINFGAVECPDFRVPMIPQNSAIVRPSSWGNDWICRRNFCESDEDVRKD